MSASVRPRRDTGYFTPDTEGALNPTYDQTHVLVESASQLGLRPHAIQDQAMH